MAAQLDDSIALIDGAWAHRQVSANGNRFHVAEMGTGPLVVFLHGFPDFWWTWRHQLPAFAQAGFRAVAMDLRGYGASDKPPRGYDGYTLAGDVVGVIRALGERDAILVGHDWGGALAWSVAAFHPRLVRGLAVLGSAHPLRLRSAMRTDRRQIAALRHLFTFQLPRYEHVITRDQAVWVKRAITSWAGPTWRSTQDFTDHIAACQQAMQITQAAFCSLEYFRWTVRSLTRRSGWRYASLLDNTVAAPVRGFHGTQDRCILLPTARGGEKFAASDYHFTELAGVGHFPHLEQVEATNVELVAWAKSVAA